MIGCTPITEGLMNPNWRLSTTSGVYALKQLRDADPAAGHRQPSDEATPGPVGWTHGDLNDLNLLFGGEDGDTVTGVLDWDRLAVRAYGLEVVRTATLLFQVGDLRRTAAFAAGYRGRVAISAAALGDAAHRRWWDLVTETWILRLHYERGDLRCDHILPRSAELRRWWTTHRDEFDAAVSPDRSAS